MKKILIGSLVRDRAWVLPDFLRGILALDYPTDEIELLFIVNDSTDASWDILERFRREHLKRYSEIFIMQISLGAPKDKRIDEIRQEIIPNLAYLRNVMLSHIGCNDFLFSVDCDILLPGNALRELLGAGKDICAGIVNNHPADFWPNIYDQRKRQPWRDYPRQQVFECDVTGAVILLSRAVCNSVQYGVPDRGGEDIFFCNDARAKGFRVFANSRVNAWHMLRHEDYAELPTEDPVRCEFSACRYSVGQKCRKLEMTGRPIKIEEIVDGITKQPLPVCAADEDD